MDWLRHLDKQTIPIRRALATALAPDPAKLEFPLFSARINDRKQRWRIERQPNPYAAVSSKTDGQSFMRALGHSVPEVYGIYPSLDALPGFADLPRSFVLKPVNGWSSAGIFLLQDGFDFIRGRSFTRDELIQTARDSAGVGSKGIAGSWMAEELLFDFHETGAPARDHKFFCFGPKVALIMVSRRPGPAPQATRYWLRDPDWQPVPLRLAWAMPLERSAVPRPPFLDEMLRIVSDVGARLNIFVRIDMYATDRGPVFGEFTAYPNMGRGYTPRGDAWLGQHWRTRDGGTAGPAAD